ncbi:MAG: hypothetical protein H0T70_09440 [Acidimicrobiia bacterium]|nr:hypothetical protein [Acidimicrobiia bacterium]
MVAITTDIQTRRRTPGRERHLAPVPDLAGAAPRLVVVTWRAPLPSRPLGTRPLGTRPLGTRPVGIGPVGIGPLSRRRATPAAYRLRRLAAALLVTGLVLVAWAVLSGIGVLSSTGASASGAAPATVVVAPGDTFWSIASRIQPSGDVRPLVDRLVADHGGTALRVGGRISVPRS